MQFYQLFGQPPILEPNEPSIFIINANGRLGNHLMAFATIMTLAKTLNIREVELSLCQKILEFEN